MHDLYLVSIHSRRNTFEVHKRWRFKWCANEDDFESSGLCVCVVLVVLVGVSCGHLLRSNFSIHGCSFILAHQALELTRFLVLHTHATRLNYYVCFIVAHQTFECAEMQVLSSVTVCRLRPLFDGTEMLCAMNFEFCFPR